MRTPEAWYYRAMRNRLAGAAVLLLLFLLSTHGDLRAESHRTYRFGYSSSQNPAVIIDSMGPLIDLLAEELDADIEFVQKSSFSEMQRAFISQEIDFGIVNAFSFLRILPYDAVVPIAARVIEGSKEYRTFFFCRQDSDISSIEDLHRKTIALGDPYSTSSFLIPHYVFGQHGINPDSDFLETVIITKQDSLILAVMNRTVDVGVSASFIYNDQPQEVRSHLKVFAQSDGFPLGPFVVNKNLDADVIARIQHTLLTLTTTERGRRALESSGFEGFDTVDVSDYEPLMRIVQDLNLN